jgi:hypothetical protein
VRNEYEDQMGIATSPNVLLYKTALNPMQGKAGTLLLEDCTLQKGMGCKTPPCINCMLLKAEPPGKNGGGILHISEQLLISLKTLFRCRCKSA